MYSFDEKTPPKEIIIGACNELTSQLQNEGYKFLKSQQNIVKREGGFIFSIHFQANRYNAKGESAEAWVSCSISNVRYDECYYGRNLGTISHINYTGWEFYGKENYEKSVSDILQRLQAFFIPLTHRFINDRDKLVLDVVDKGFYPDNETTGYEISTDFLLRYGNTELLQKAIQKYYDLCYPQAKANFKKSVLALSKGKEPDTLYAFWKLAEAVVEHNISISY